MLIPFHDDNPVRRWPVVTVGIIVVNVVSFIYVSGMTDIQQEKFWIRNGFVPQRIAQLVDHKPVEVPLKLQPDLEPVKLEAQPVDIYLSLVTCMFLHGGVLHLLGNMWFFWIFGNNIEDRLGHFIFFCFYLLGGIIASMCHWATTGGDGALIPVIGASGAVAVIMGAYAVTYPTAKVRTVLFIIVFFTVIELPALVVLGIWFLFEVLHAFAVQAGAVTNVALWAHIGGFVTGAVFMPLLAAGTPEPGDDWNRESRQQFDYERGVPDAYAPRPPRNDQRGITWEE